MKKRKTNLLNLHGEEFVLEKVERNNNFIQVIGYVETVAKVVHNMKKHEILKLKENKFQ